MRKKVVILIIVMLLGACLAPFAIASNTCFAEDIDPVGVNSATFYVNTENGGDVLVTLAVENHQSEPIDVEFSDWSKYTYPDSTQTWIEPEWLVSIDPSSITLPVGGQTIANVLYHIPEDAAEIKYITWVKVKVGEWQKPITIIIRKGEAIEEVDFAVSPSYFKVSVKTGATKTYSNWQDIMVINKAGSELLAYATAERKDAPLEITAESSIKHTEEEIGDIYQNISTEQAQQWFETNYTEENPFTIPASGKKGLPWGLEIPNSVKNGKYVFGIRIASANHTNSMLNINYKVWVLLDINRTESSGLSIAVWMWILAGISAGIIGVIIVTEIRRRVNFKFSRA